MENSIKFEYVGFWKRILTTIIDLVAAFVIFILSSHLVAIANELRSIIPLLIRDILYMGFWVIMVAKFGGTPGELILQMRVVNKNGQFISLLSALFRSLPILIILLGKVLYVNHAYSNIPVFTDAENINVLLRAHGGIYGVINAYLGYIHIPDYGAIIFDKKKRSLHDFLAGSFVITKKSYKHVNSLQAG
jgi:uncharacterized RDD family membrane protein YckC